ncbi:MAG: SsrA-binding protein SmpB [Acidobacteriota bacterium]
MKVIATNKKGYHNYEIIEIFEAGISLLGSEVKSIREGRVNLRDSYATLKNGEIFLVNSHISSYKYSSYFNHDPYRERKLLLHKSQIRKITGKIKEKGLTLIPLKIYINERGIIKLELALAKGRKVWEKKELIKERDIKREMEKELRRRN